MIRKFDLVVALYIFGVITAELLGSKTFPLGTIGGMAFNASVAIFVLPLLFTLTDIVVEVHGKQRARGMVWCGIIAAALLIGYTALASALPPSMRSAGTEAAYDTIFGMSARIAAASLIAFAVSEMLDVLVFSKLRERLHNKALWLRNNLSNIVSQFVDSAVFLTVAFYAFDKSLGANAVFLLGLLLPYWLLRCLVSAVETPFVYWGVKWLRKPQKGVSDAPQEA
jgi:queuosine precursor transporter